VQLLTVADAAKALAVHEDTVRRLIARDELKATHVGRNVRIDERELEAYVRRLRTPEQPSQISTGQLKAFHAKAADLDRLNERPARATKRIILMLASSQFGRAIESANDLDEREASWCLDQLEDMLDAAVHAA
jgi:excisionase family DNA binding protein